MTDKLKGVVVTFDRDVRVDDAEPILAAIRMIRCVASVEPVVGNIDDEMNRARVKRELAFKFLDFYQELLGMKPFKE